MKSRPITMNAVIISLLCAVLTAALWGCAPSGKYGRLEHDDEVKKLWLSLEILPDHNYYFVGGQNSPRVIIGIDQQYTLKSDIWKPIDLTQEQLRIWIDRTGTRAKRDMSRSGQYILDQDGNRLGIWFGNKSDLDFSRIERLDGNEITISAVTERDKRSHRKSEDK